MNTQLRKGSLGWTADTYVPLDDGYALHFCTMKYGTGGVHTTAKRVKPEPGGHSYSYTLFEDFNMTVPTDDKVLRATEKSVLEQHKRALAKLAEVQQACEAHYSMPPVDPFADQFRL